MKKTLTLLAIALMMIAVAVGQVPYDECDGPCTEGDLNSSRLDIDTCIVEINDRLVKDDRVVLKAFERGEGLEVEVEFVSRQRADDVQVMAFITGYHRTGRFTESLVDITPTFDVEPNVAYQKDLFLELPEDFDLDTGDEVKLRLEISDKFSTSYIQEFNLKVEALRDLVVIQDIILDPSTRVMAGRGLFANVRLRNMGEDDEESVKVVTSIPALGIRQTEYIDELEADEATTSEDMFLRIPVCAEPGQYTVEVSVDYADGDETVTEETTIRVDENPDCDIGDGEDDDEEGRTVVTVPGRQDVTMGTQGTAFPVIIENSGNSDRTYELSVSGIETWGEVRFNPGSLVLIEAGESETVYMFVEADEEAPEGEKVFMLTVETNGDRKQIPLTANVVAGEPDSPIDLDNMENFLLIALIVVIVLLVILGLVVGFSRLRDENDGDEGTGQTYY